MGFTMVMGAESVITSLLFYVINFGSELLDVSMTGKFHLSSIYLIILELYVVRELQDILLCS